MSKELPNLDLRPDHMDIVRDVLRRHVPDRKVLAFGSRVTWTAKHYSDLDLAVLGDEPLPLNLTSALAESFDDSDLPFKVDVVDWASTSESFRKVIERDYVVLVNEHDQPLRESNSREDSVWLESLLGELTDNFDSIRVPVKQADRQAGPYPYYGESGIVDHIDDYLFNGEYLLIAEDGENLRTRNTPITFLANGKFWVNNHAHILRGNHKANTRYLMYALSALDISGYLTGSTMPKLTQGNMNRIRMITPPLPEQRVIAHILGTLDDKIELNRRMNETLEAMARALFKSWFVDFDPVRARMEGRDTGLPSNIADLFPDRLVDSELGEIPEGWEVKTLGEELKCLVSGARPRGGAIETGIPSIGAENVVGLGQYDFSKTKYIPKEFFEKLKTKAAIVQKGDILLYKDGAYIGRKTYLDYEFPYSDCAVNEHVFILRLRNKEAQRYLFFWLDQDSMTQEIISLNSNSAQPGINQAGVRSLPLLVPSREILHTFNQHSGLLTDHIFTNCHQSRTLIALRDALLPKLVSGELRMSHTNQDIAPAI